MLSRIVYNPLKVKIATGQLSYGGGISLDAGTCVGVYFVPTKDPEADFDINIEVKTSQGDIILNGTDYRDYTHKQGGYFNGMKPVGFPSKPTRFEVSVTAEQALTKDFAGQLIFVVEREKEDE
jgi:hypothetical protein